MNKSTVWGWILLMGLFLLWTTHKSNQAREAQAREAAKQDSIARVEKARKAAAGPAAPADTTAGPGRLSAAGEEAIMAPAGAAGATDSLAKEAPPAVTQRTLTVVTDNLVVGLDNLGARVTRLAIKNLHGKEPHQPVLISPEKGGALVLNLDNRDLGKVLWKLEDIRSGRLDGDTLRVEDGPVQVSFTHADANGGLTRTYTFYPDSNKFRHDLDAAGQVENYALKWPSGINETEPILLGKGIGLTSNFFSEVVFDNGVTVMREAFEGKKVFNEESGTVRWAGLRRKYVAAVMNFHRETHNKVISTSSIPEGRDDNYPREYDLQLAGMEYENNSLDFDFLVLPLSYGGLKEYGQNYEKIIFSGWEWFLRADVWYVGLCGLVLKLLKGFYELIPNWGVAIILLTLLVRTVTFPLTIAQTKQGVRMTQHAPAIQKIREKNKGNPQKANLEIMEYYKKQGINPFASVMGCFPVLLQMPIFIALFNVLGRAVELKDAPFVGWIGDLSMPDIVWSGFTVPYIFPLGLTVLPFFMAGTMWIQMKMTIKDPNQKMLVWMMPVMMFVFSCSFPSGLVLYWTISNVFTIGQTYFYTNRLTRNAAASTGAKPPSAGKPVPRKPAKT